MIGYTFSIYKKGKFKRPSLCFVAALEVTNGPMSLQVGLGLGLQSCLMGYILISGFQEVWAYESHEGANLLAYILRNHLSGTFCLFYSTG